MTTTHSAFAPMLPAPGSPRPHRLHLMEYRGYFFFFYQAELFVILQCFTKAFTCEDLILQSCVRATLTHRE